LSDKTTATKIQATFVTSEAQTLLYKRKPDLKGAHKNFRNREVAQFWWSFQITVTAISVCLELGQVVETPLISYKNFDKQLSANEK